MSDYPLPGFRFKVEFFVATENASNLGSSKPICSGAFAECSGLEASMETRAIRVGGNNFGEIQRAGRVSFGTVILKRGVSTTRDLWKWFELVGTGAYAYRLDAMISLLDFGDSEGWSTNHSWYMLNALPNKFKAADFVATSNEVGVEELHFVHEGMYHLYDD